jgi:FMN phosphatase YigB (HAD superfamily)
MINLGKEWDWMYNKNNKVMDKWVIFDLDGTLADIEDRRQLCTKENGKMDWNKFFDPENIKLDKPNMPVIMMAQALTAFGYKIAIFSGRSAKTKDATKDWLHKQDIKLDILKMRPERNFRPDEQLKLEWLNDMDWKDNVVAVFDDRDKVVNMWREIGLTCMQVAPGNF